MNKEYFSYCIGRPDKDDPTNIITYTYGSTVFHGDEEAAEKTRDFISKRAGREYFIYKLIKS